MEMSEMFKNGFEMLSKAQVEQQINFEHGDVPNETSMLLIGPAGQRLLADLETLVRSTLRRA